MSSNHEQFMRAALRLARKGLGLTSPNPAVGCIVVKRGKVIGRGFHERAGLPHAEVMALEECGKGARGAAMYVTLEPCCHTGRTPPCTEAIISAGIRKVYVGMKDPNPSVSGKGIRKLKSTGVDLISGLLEKECKVLNEAYIKYITRKSPFVTLKIASSLDGRIATGTGQSKWITGKGSRQLVHRMRSLADCVMVGSGTLIKDDPGLTVRYVRGRNPIRAVVDSTMKIPLDAKVFGSGPGGLIIFTSRKAGKARIKRAEAEGAEVVTVRETKEGVSLGGVMKELYKRGVASLLIEGGGRLAASAIRAGVVDKVSIFLSPMLLGGDSKPSIADLNIKALKDCPRLERVSVRKIDRDLLIEGYL